MRHILIYIYSSQVTAMSKSNSKVTRLKQMGLLNPHPERVNASWFQSNSFFDPHDIAQVKYEMLRSVQIDGASKADAATLFGVSRPTYYQAEADYVRDGLAGLMPRQRGPKGPHKLDTELMGFIETQQEMHGHLSAIRLAELILEKFGINVHPRSIERAITRKKKR